MGSETDVSRHLQRRRGAVSAWEVGRDFRPSAAHQKVRAMVHRQPGRAEALRAVGAQVVVGDLKNPGSTWPPH